MVGGDEWLKLTAFFNERQRSGRCFLADALPDLYAQQTIAGSVVLRGVGGFGPRRQLRSDQSLSLSEDPPIVLVAVDTKSAIEELLDPLRAMSKRALITLERTQGTADETGFAIRADETLKLTIYLGRGQRIHRRPGYVTLCDLVHRNGFDGAWVFAGVDGTVYGLRERAGFFRRNIDVPAMIVAVGSARRAARLLAQLRQLVPGALITVEQVRVCKRDGNLLQRPQPVPGTDEHGLALWQKLVVYTSDAERHDGWPIHRALVHRLWQHRVASGATVLRAVWGFNGCVEPGGDRLLRLTRRVPVATVVIDAPQRIAETFEVIDELTTEHGLVTSEVVPALILMDGDTRHNRTELANYR